MSARPRRFAALVAALAALLAPGVPARAEEEGPEIELTVIGFDIAPGSSAEKVLQEMAAAGGGVYLPVQPGEGGRLADAILEGAGVLPRGAVEAGPAAGGPEREPNDRRSRATPAAPVAEMTGTVSPRGDRDWYRVAVPHQGQLEVSVTPTAATMALWIEVYDADNRRLAGPFYATRDGAPTSGTADLPEPGSYWLHLGDRDDRGASVDPYRLGLAFTPTVDALEPNQTVGKAALIPATGTIAAAILPRGDRDWYRVEVERQGELAVEVKAPPKNLDIWIEVYDADHRRIAGPFYPARRGFENAGVADLPEPGRYYVHIGDRDDADRSVEPYALDLRFTPSVDIFEPSRTLGKARPIHATGSIRATILPRGDRDWYRVETAAHGELKVDVKAPPKNLDIWIEVYDEDHRRIAGPFYPARRGFENAGVADLPAPGRYYVHLGDRDDADRSVLAYTLETTFTASPDRGEPNPDLKTAARLSPDAPVEGTILPRGDRDWYEVAAERRSKLEVEVKPVPKDLLLWVEVYEAGGRRIAGPFYAAREGAEVFAEAALPAAGRYYLQLGVRDDAKRSVEPYRLLVKLTPAP